VAGGTVRGAKKDPSPARDAAGHGRVARAARHQPCRGIARRTCIGPGYRPAKRDYKNDDGDGKEQGRVRLVQRGEDRQGAATGVAASRSQGGEASTFERPKVCGGGSSSNCGILVILVLPKCIEVIFGAVANTLVAALSRPALFLCVTLFPAF